jgi:hypothetical protein
MNIYIYICKSKYWNRKDMRKGRYAEEEEAVEKRKKIRYR